MARCGTAAGLVAALWVERGLGPTEVLDCPPPILAAVVASLHAQREQAIKEEVDAHDQAAWTRMHEQLRKGG